MKLLDRLDALESRVRYLTSGHADRSDAGHEMLTYYPLLARLIRAQAAMLRIYRDGDSRGGGAIAAEYLAALKACEEAGQ